MTHTESFPIAMSCNFCSRTFKSFSGNLVLLDPSLTSRNISPKEKFDRAESLEECSRVSAGLGESRTLGVMRYFKRL
jgi:hypothetical protein